MNLSESISGDSPGEVFSTEDFKTSLRCFLDGTLQCFEVFSKKVHRVDSCHLVCRGSFDETLQDEVFSEKTSGLVELLRTLSHVEVLVTAKCSQSNYFGQRWSWT